MLTDENALFRLSTMARSNTTHGMGRDNVAAVKPNLDRDPAEAGADEAVAAQPAIEIKKRGPTNSDAAVGREIRQHRRSAGLTQKQLAKVVGVTGAQLHRYETGATRIAASRLIAIANALGVRTDSLLAVASAGEMGNRATSTPNTSDEIVELIQVFGSIADPKHRSALVAVARMMTSPYQRQAAPEEEV
jgi:transcriptional regulator with XRE-family HTH domain